MYTDEIVRLTEWVESEEEFLTGTPLGLEMVDGREWCDRFLSQVQLNPARVAHVAKVGSVVSVWGNPFRYSDTCPCRYCEDFVGLPKVA